MRISAILSLLLTVLLLLPASAAPGAEPDSSETLTNQDVIDLLEADLNRELIEQKIRSSKNNFDMSTRAMIVLKKANVPDDIIALMLNEHRSQISKVNRKISLEIQHLVAERPEVRDAAFLKLKQYGDTALRPLRDTLAHLRAPMRAAAAYTLARLGDAKSLPLMRGLLTDSVADVRYAAAQGLYELDDKESVILARRAVTGGLDPLDGYLRLLGHFKDVKAAGFVKLRMLESGDKLTRAQAAWALGEIGWSEALDTLENAIDVNQEREPSVRREAVLALGKIQADSSVQKLIRVCTTDPQVRREVMLALGNFPADATVPFLVGTLQRRLAPAELQAALDSLRKLTHKDFGNNYARWSAWLEKNRDKLKGMGPAKRSQQESGTGGDSSPRSPQADPSAALPPKSSAPADQARPGNELPAPRENDNDFRAVPRHAKPPRQDDPPSPSEQDKLPDLDARQLRPEEKAESLPQELPADVHTLVPASQPDEHSAATDEAPSAAGDSQTSIWTRDTTGPRDQTAGAPRSRGQNGADEALPELTPEELVTDVPGIVSITRADEGMSPREKKQPGQDLPQEDPESKSDTLAEVDIPLTGKDLAIIDGPAQEEEAETPLARPVADGEDNDDFSSAAVQQGKLAPPPVDEESPARGQVLIATSDNAPSASDVHVASTNPLRAEEGEADTTAAVSAPAPAPQPSPPAPQRSGAVSSMADLVAAIEQLAAETEEMEEEIAATPPAAQDVTSAPASEASTEPSETMVPPAETEVEPIVADSFEDTEDNEEEASPASSPPLPDTITTAEPSEPSSTEEEISPLQATPSKPEEDPSQTPSKKSAAKPDRKWGGFFHSGLSSTKRRRPNFTTDSYFED